ncbi:MAG: hypothetical protein JNL79_26410 [Myxococcales bacterium]|nr:hypothetical protein [Myxococcales bacterium]
MSRLIPPTQFPPPHPSDPEPVGWALCTAAALWKAKRYGDSVAWIQKAAANAASLHGDGADSNVRVVELTIAATELAHYVRKWEHGDDDADPSSIPVSTDFQEIDLEVESVDPAQLAPRKNATAAPVVIKPAMPPRRRAETLQQEQREVPLPRTIPVARPLPAAPRVVMKGKRAMLSTTLPEAVPAPSILGRQPPPSITATEEVHPVAVHGPPTKPLHLDFDHSILAPAPREDGERVDPTDREPPMAPSQADTVVAPDLGSLGLPGGTLPGAAYLVRAKDEPERK